MKLAVCLSGRGSNLGALLKFRDQLPDIACVLSDQAEAQGLQVARQASLPVIVCPRFRGQCKGDHEASMLEALKGVDVVILAGFMRLLSIDFIAEFRAVVNIHPSLLPAFPGLHTHARALDAGVRVHGCTVHLVDAGVDTGLILAQAGLEVREGESTEALAARVLRLEHGLFGPTLINFFNSRSNGLLANESLAG